MKDISNSNFGLLIAYALPGFVVIWGISGVWPVSPGCFGSAASCSAVPSLIGFLNSTVAAIAAGMAVSAVRFMVIDTVHHLTNLKRPSIQGADLHQNFEAVSLAVEHHYRHYQFHANMLIAGLIAYGAYLHHHAFTFGLIEVLILILAATFWITGRDNLRKYYHTLNTIPPEVTPEITPEMEQTMSNGMTSENHRKDKQSKQDKTTKEAKDKAQKQSKSKSS